MQCRHYAPSIHQLALEKHAEQQRFAPVFEPWQIHWLGNPFGSMIPKEHCKKCEECHLNNAAWKRGSMLGGAMF
jgi:hypothetical protein